MKRHWDMIEFHHGDRVTDLDLLERRLDVYAAFCGKRPPKELVIDTEKSHALQEWVIENLLPQFNYATGICILDAADAIAESQIDNGYEKRQND